MLATVQKWEKKTKTNIRDLYRDIENASWCIDMCYRMMSSYQLTKYSHLQPEKRKKHILELRESIYQINEDIKYYKKCIEAEKKELKRLHEEFYGGTYTEPIYFNSSFSYQNYYDEMEYDEMEENTDREEEQEEGEGEQEDEVWDN